MKRQGFTLVELLMVIAIIGLIAAVMLPSLARAREAVRRSSCANNLKQMGLVLKMYANESNGGEYPMNGTRVLNNIYSGKNNRYEKYALDGIGLYPEYLSDPRIMCCPSDSSAYKEDLQFALDTIRRGDPHGIFAGVDLSTPSNQRHATTKLLQQVYSYGYLAWATNDQDSFFGFRRGHTEFHITYCKKNDACTPCDMNTDIDLEALGLTLGDPWVQLVDDIDPVPVLSGSNGGSILYRIRSGVERFFITDISSSAASAQAQGTIPVYFDLLGTAQRPNNKINLERVANTNHLPGGSNVLFMDGHVEFVKYPGKYPVTAPVAFGISSGGVTAPEINLDELK